MKKEELFELFGEINESYISQAHTDTRKKTRTVWVRLSTIAACFVLILSIAFTAEATKGTVSNLFAPLFGGAQTEIVEEIGVPIEASASVNGYTLTADAIIGDRYSFIVMYTLSRDDGQPIPDHVAFEKFTHTLGGSGSVIGDPIVKETDNPSVAHFSLRWHRGAPVVGKILTSSFSTLVIDDRDDETEDVVVAEGMWKLTFALRYPDATVEIPMHHLSVTDAGGSRYEVERMMLSAVGVHFDLILHEPDVDAFGGNFQVSIVLKDGTEIPLEGGGSGRWTEGDKKTEVTHYASFDTLINSEDIQAILICDTVYEINIPGEE